MEKTQWDNIFQIRKSGMFFVMYVLAGELDIGCKAPFLLYIKKDCILRLIFNENRILIQMGNCPA